MTVRRVRAGAPTSCARCASRRRYTRHAEGSVLIEIGRHAGAVHGERRGGRAAVPARARGRAGSPPSTACCRARRTRATRREAAEGKQSGRTQEIQRLIGRSLRAVVDLAALGERTIPIDCDVLQADGGTRCASITGACVALADAIAWCRDAGSSQATPLRDFVAAVSVGIVDGAPVLDLDYAEDSACDTDMNVVMTGARRLRRGAGHGRGRAVLARRDGRARRARRARHPRARRGAEGGAGA